MLLYAGRLTDREPFHLGEDSPKVSWFHVGVPPDETHPVRVAADQATLAAEGGDVIYPGTTIDLPSFTGIWIDGPTVGGMPFVWVELRAAPTHIHVDPLGQLRAVVGAKVSLHELEPRVWQNVSTTVVGMVAWKVKAEGGKVWVGTHNDTKLTPYDPNPTSGVSWPLEDGEETPWIPGNPVLNAWTDEPKGSLRFWKLLRGREF